MRVFMIRGVPKRYGRTLGVSRVFSFFSIWDAGVSAERRQDQDGVNVRRRLVIGCLPRDELRSRAHARHDGQSPCCARAPDT